jgi:hypothetical protein
MVEESGSVRDLRGELIFLCERAMVEESGSVRVRLREILIEIQ